MNKMRTIITLLLLLWCSFYVQAQDSAGKYDFGQTMRSNGRIYVVVAVMLTILLGLIIYLVRLDRKISKAEKQN